MNSPPHDDHLEEADSIVRPYMLTRGRTRSEVTVAMETMVDRLGVQEEQYKRFDTAQRTIWETLTDRKSAAEVSALTKLPLGVVCVLLGDMASTNYIRVHQTASTGDVDLVRRLIDGVRAL